MEQPELNDKPIVGDATFKETIRLRLPPISGFSYPYTNLGIPVFGTWRQETKWFTGQLQTNLLHYSNVLAGKPAAGILKDVEMSKPETYPICSETHVSATVVVKIRYNHKYTQLDKGGQFSAWAKTNVLFYKEKPGSPNIAFSPMFGREFTGLTTGEKAPLGRDYIRNINTAVGNVLSRQPGKIEKTEHDRGMFLTTDFMFVLQDVYPWMWTRSQSFFYAAAEASGFRDAERSCPFDLGAPRGEATIPLFCFDWNLFCKYMGVKLNVMHQELAKRLGIVSNMKLQMCVFCMPNSFRKRYNESYSEEFERKTEEFRSADKLSSEPAALVAYLKSSVMPVWFLPIALQVVANLNGAKFEYNQCLFNVAQQLMHLASSGSLYHQIASLCVNRFTAVFNLVYSTRGSFVTDMVFKHCGVVNEMRAEIESLRETNDRLVSAVVSLAEKMKIITPIFLDPLENQPENWEECILNSHQQASLIAWCAYGRNAVEELQEKYEAMREKCEQLEEQVEIKTRENNDIMVDHIIGRATLRVIVDRLGITTEEIDKAASDYEAINEHTAFVGNGWVGRPAIRKRKFEESEDSKEK